MHSEPEKRLLRLFFLLDISINVYYITELCRLVFWVKKKKKKWDDVHKNTEALLDTCWLKNTFLLSLISINIIFAFGGKNYYGRKDQ